MVAPFRMDEQVTIEQRPVSRDPVYNTELDGDEGWVVLADHVWAWVQDELPRQAESEVNGVRISLRKTRLRIRVDDRVAMDMRVTLHGRGDRVMRILLGPALLDDRRHMEMMLEDFGHG